MKYTAEHKIVQLLSQHPDKLLSITDLAKQLKLAYSHAYTAIMKLKQDNIITTQRVGGALICSLNLAEPLTRALLAQISYHNAKSWFKKHPHATKIMDRIFTLRDSIEIVAAHNKKILIVPQPTVPGERFAQFHNRDIVTKQKLKKSIYKDCTLLYGAEKYWEP